MIKCDTKQYAGLIGYIPRAWYIRWLNLYHGEAAMIYHIMIPCDTEMYAWLIQYIVITWCHVIKNIFKSCCYILPNYDTIWYKTCIMNCISTVRYMWWRDNMVISLVAIPRIYHIAHSHIVMRQKYIQLHSNTSNCLVIYSTWWYHPNHTTCIILMA